MAHHEDTQDAPNKEVSKCNPCSLHQITTKQKRKQQNRQAQRAFRARRENYVTDMERRLKELEEENQQLREHNKGLLHQVNLLKDMIGGARNGNNNNNLQRFSQRDE